MSWTNLTKNIAQWVRGILFLATEDLDYLITEDGRKIILDQSIGVKNIAQWVNQNKNG